MATRGRPLLSHQGLSIMPGSAFSQGDKRLRQCDGRGGLHSPGNIRLHLPHPSDKFVIHLAEKWWL